MTSTNEEGQICSLLLKQLARGTEIIVVDPKTALAEKRNSGSIETGSDHALALAFLNVIITKDL
jgi:hypothetical protein